MPTAKPRLNVTLQPATYATIQRLANASGDSMSSIVASFADLVAPSLERVADAIEAAKQAPEEVRAGLLAAVQRAERDLVPLTESAQQAQAQADAAMSRIAAAARPPTHAQRAGRAGRGGRS